MYQDTVCISYFFPYFVFAKFHFQEEKLEIKFQFLFLGTETKIRQ
jgi:hypothetical protein